MRKLFRCSYMRVGKVQHMTFAARNLALASEFAFTVLQGYVLSISGSFILDVQALGIAS